MEVHCRTDSTDSEEGGCCLSLDSSSLATITSRSAGGGSVSFGMVQINEHAMVLSDNPSTSAGPSVELGWDSQSHMTFDTVDEYESLRDARRTKTQLLLSSRERKKVLLDNGFTFREIQEETAKRRKKAQELSRRQAMNVFRRFSDWKKKRVNERVRQRDQRMKAILESLDSHQGS